MQAALLLVHHLVVVRPPRPRLAIIAFLPVREREGLAGESGRLDVYARKVKTSYVPSIFKRWPYESSWKGNSVEYSL